MKQFFCVLVTLAASAALLFLVSAPVGGEHGGESTTAAHGETVAGGTHGTEAEGAAHGEAGASSSH
ncbi:MAG: hypothetical protein PUC32_00185 [Oscillospiraceae bacterium]|nr:hypothetical protein [Oscillospiraceae bacterium]